MIIPGMTYYNPTYNFGIGLSQLSATGISLSCLCVSTITSSYQFIQDNKVDFEIASYIAIPSMISARLGTIYIAKHVSNTALALFFNGASIILIPTHFFIQQRRRNKDKKAVTSESQTEEQHSVEKNTSNHQKHRKDGVEHSKNDDSTCDNGNNNENGTSLLLQHSMYGIISGLISSLMGVGGLPLTISYLTEYTSLHHHYIQGTAITALLPSIITSAYSRRSAIIPHLPITCCVGCGAIMGGYVGSYYAIHHLNEMQLRNLYMLSLLVFGTRSMMGAYSNLRSLGYLPKKKLFPK